MLTDRLGNAWSGRATPRSWLQTTSFGVDATPPVIEDIEPDDYGVFGPSIQPAFEFEIQNPKLASGDAGSIILVGHATVTIPGRKSTDDPVPVGEVKGYQEGREDDATASINLPRDGSYPVTVTVKDQATPPNAAAFTRTVVPGYEGADLRFPGRARRDDQRQPDRERAGVGRDQGRDEQHHEGPPYCPKEHGCAGVLQRPGPVRRARR